MYEDLKHVHDSTTEAKSQLSQHTQQSTSQRVFKSPVKKKQSKQPKEVSDFDDKLLFVMVFSCQMTNSLSNCSKGYAG